jgi:hypothetical protein
MNIKTREDLIKKLRDAFSRTKFMPPMKEHDAERINKVAVYGPPTTRCYRCEESIPDDRGRYIYSINGIDITYCESCVL